MSTTKQISERLATLQADNAHQDGNDDDDDIDLSTDTLLHDSASRRNPLVEIQISFYIHMANVVFCLFCLLIAALPYYHYFGRTPSIVGFAVNFGVSLVLYAGIIYLLHTRHFEAVVIVALFWLPTVALSIGFLSAIVYNVTPIQFMLMSMIQSITIVSITRTSPDWMPWYLAAGASLASSAVVWCISIYAFVVEADWVFAGFLMLAGSLLLAAYNGRQVIRSKTYVMNRESITTAVLHYYCGDVCDLIAKYLRR